MQWLEASQHRCEGCGRKCGRECELFPRLFPPLPFLSTSNRPNFCVQMLTRIIARAGLPTELVLRMDENLSELVSAISSCERIINTPIPMSYTRHTARFLVRMG